MLVRLLCLGPGGWWDLAEAQFWIFHARWRLRTQPKGTLVRAGPVKGTGAGEPSTDGWPRAERAASAVDRVARLGIGRPLCLARSLALQRMLERRGLYGSTIRVGVRGSGTDLSAHAWVQWGERVLGDRPDHVAAYHPLDALRVGASSLDEAPTGAEPLP